MFLLWLLRARTRTVVGGEGTRTVVGGEGTYSYYCSGIVRVRTRTVVSGENR